jgi:hypothetical protein
MTRAPFPIINVSEIGPTIGSGQIALGLGTGPAMYGEVPLPASGQGEPG